MTPSSPKPLPVGLARLGAALITLHFLAIGVVVLAAPSGTWPTRFGESMSPGPKFAEALNNNIVAPAYAGPLRLNSNYHFASNRSLISAVYFEARLKDSEGTVTKTVKFPGDSGNFWRRHRYKLFALGLGSDIPVQPPGGEVIPAPGKQMEKMIIWDITDPKMWRLKEVPEHLVPKDRPVMRPSEWSLLLAHSYARYFLRDSDVASVEIIRHSKDQVLPAFMYVPSPPPGAFDELVCSFGEERREK